MSIENNRFIIINPGDISASAHPTTPIFLTTDRIFHPVDVMAMAIAGLALDKIMILPEAKSSVMHHLNIATDVFYTYKYSPEMGGRSQKTLTCIGGDFSFCTRATSPEVALNLIWHKYFAKCVENIRESVCIDALEYGDEAYSDFVLEDAHARRIMYTVSEYLRRMGWEDVGRYHNAVTFPDVLFSCNIQKSLVSDETYVVENGVRLLDALDIAFSALCSLIRSVVEEHIARMILTS